MKKLLLVLLAISISGAAVAEEKRQSFKDMTPQQKQAVIAKKDAEWNALSKEQKIARMEKDRAERLAKLADKLKADNQKWTAMSNDEKLAIYDKRAKAFKSRILNAKPKKPGC